MPPMMGSVFTKAEKLGTLENGDYYEFGVFNGYSIYHAQQLMKKKNRTGMRFWGFDSFAGLPEIEEKDKGGVFYKGQYSYPKEDAIKNIVTHKGDMNSISLIEGFFSDSLTPSLISKQKMKKIAVAYIDCDLYSSTKDVLAFIRPLLMKDSLIIFDDWNSFLGESKDKGEQLAFAEFREKNPNIHFASEFTYCWHGKVFRVTDIPTEKH